MKSTSIIKRARSRSLAALIAVSAPFTVAALESDLEQPIMIEADSLEIDDRAGTSLYRGNVDIRQGTIHITADSVKVTQKEGQPDHLLAKGKPVTFKQQTDQKGQWVEGKADTAEYHADSDTLYLSGQAELKQGADNFASDRIIYDRARAVVKAGASAQGKKRVRVSIQPTKKKQSP